MVTDKTKQTIRLKDGRTLGYAEYGAPEGKPVLFFHSQYASRLQGQLVDAAATRLNARIIAVDRPGMGLSDFKHGRRLLDWSDDVVELADTLGIDRVAVAGHGGGGPYVAACAFKIPQRLTTAAIISGMCSLNVRGATDGMDRIHRLFCFSVRRAPWLLGLVLRLGPLGTARHDGDMSRLKAYSPEPDQAALERPEVPHIIRDAILEAFRSGTRGPAWDARLLFGPWGFPPQEISIEIYLWHGEADRASPPAMGQYVANAIPNCRAKFVPDEGHVSLVINHMEEILSGLLSTGDW